MRVSSAKNVRVALLNMVSYDPARTVRHQPFLPLSVIAGYVRANKSPAEVTVFDMQGILKRMPPVETAGSQDKLFKALHEEETGRILEGSPQVMGFSMRWDTVDATQTIIETAIARGHNPLFVLGSYLPTYASDELLTRFQTQIPKARIVAVLGEGEEAMLEIIARIEKDPDLALKELNGTPNVKTAPRATVNYQRVNLARYPILTPENAPELFSFWSIPIETSRGCPWARCTFCSLNGLYGPGLGGWQPFPVEYILHRIKLGAEMGVRRFYIIDSEFMGPTRTPETYQASVARAESLAMGLVRLNKEMGLAGTDAPIHFSHYALRTDVVHSERNPGRNPRSLQLLERLRDSGFGRVYLGIESGSRHQLKRYGKGVTVAENEGAIEDAKQLGLTVEVGFIFFDPLATIDDLRENVAFIERTGLHRTDSRLLGELRVHAGSKIHRMLEKQSLITNPLDIDSLEYPAEYKDAHVKLLRDIFFRWEQQTRGLTRALSSDPRRKGNNHPQQAQMDDLIDRLRQLDFYLIKDLCALGFSELSTPSNLSRVLITHLETLDAIRNEIRSIPKENLIEEMEQILANSEAATRGLTHLYSPA